MKELIEKLEAAFTAFKNDAVAQAENGNKAAGIRLGIYPRTRKDID